MSPKGEVENGVHSHVSYPSKLFQQIPREKSDDCVLGGDDLVRRIDVLLVELALVISVVWREVLVDDDGAGRTEESLPGEEILNVEGSQLVVPRKGAAGFLLPLGSHDGRGVGRRCKRRRGMGRRWEGKRTRAKNGWGRGT